MLANDNKGFIHENDNKQSSTLTKKENKNPWHKNEEERHKNDANAPSTKEKIDNIERHISAVDDVGAINKKRSS